MHLTAATILEKKKKKKNSNVLPAKTLFPSPQKQHMLSFEKHISQACRTGKGDSRRAEAFLKKGNLQMLPLFAEVLCNCSQLQLNSIH